MKPAPRPPPLHPLTQGFFRIIKNQGGGGDPSPKTPSPPPQTKVTIVGKNEIYNRENPAGHIWYTKFWVQNPLPPSPPLLKRSPALTLLHLPAASCWAAVGLRYMYKRLGLSSSQLKQLSYVIRNELMMQAAEDLVLRAKRCVRRMLWCGATPIWGGAVGVCAPSG